MHEIGQQKSWDHGKRDRNGGLTLFKVGRNKTRWVRHHRRRDFWNFWAIEHTWTAGIRLLHLLRHTSFHIHQQLCHANRHQGESLIWFFRTHETTFHTPNTHHLFIRASLVSALLNFYLALTQIDLQILPVFLLSFFLRKLPSSR